MNAANGLQLTPVSRGRPPRPRQVLLAGDAPLRAARSLAVAVLLLWQVCTVRSDESPLTDMDGYPLPPGAVLRLGSSLLSHPANILAIAVSDERRELVTLADDGCLRTWDSKTHELIRAAQIAFERPTRGIKPIFWPGLALAPDGRRVAIADREAVYVVSRWSGEIEQTIALEEFRPVVALCFLEGGREICVARPESISVFEVATGALRGDEIKLVPNGRCTAAGSMAAYAKRAEIELYDLGTLKSAGQIRVPGEDTYVTALAFSRDARLLATVTVPFRLYNSVEVNRAGTLLVYDVETHECVFRLPGACASNAKIRFSSDSTRLLALRRGQATVFDLATRAKISEFSPTPRTMVGELVDRGRTVFAFCADKLGAWDAETGAQLRSTHFGAMRGAAFVAGGKRVVTAGDDGVLHVWDVASGRHLQYIERQGAALGLPMAPSPDGKAVLCAAQFGDYLGGEQALYLLPASDDVSEPKPIALPERANALAVSAETSLFAAGCEQHVYLIDAQTRQIVSALKPHFSHPPRRRRHTHPADWPASVYAIAFSPHGEFLAAVGYDTERVGLATFDVAARAPLEPPRLLERPPRWIAFGPGRATLVLGAPNGCHLLELTTGTTRFIADPGGGWVVWAGGTDANSIIAAIAYGPGAGAPGDNVVPGLIIKKISIGEPPEISGVCELDGQSEYPTVSPDRSLMLVPMRDGTGLIYRLPSQEDDQEGGAACFGIWIDPHGNNRRLKVVGS